MVVARGREGPASRSGARRFWSSLLRLLLVLIVVLLAGPQPAAGQPAIPAPAPTATAPPPDIEIFVREGCPHCAAAEVFLAALGRDRPELTIVVHDLGQEPAALARLKEMAQARGSSTVRVPAIFVGDQLLIGFSPEAGSGKLVLDALTRTPGSATLPAGATGAAACEAEAGLSCDAEGEGFTVTAFGRTVSLDGVGLPLFTVVMGLLDGLNPCSMWVLILMISLLAPLHDRRRMLAIAGFFVLIQGVAYFAIMAAWLNLFLFIGLSRASELVLGAIAIVAGMINLKDFWAFHWGISLSIPDAAKPGIYSRMRGILRADSLITALAGTLVLGALVQIVELVCTSGFPALFTRILTLRQLDGASYYGYLLLYDAAYMLDDVIVLAIGVATLSNRRLQEKEGRVLKLASGLAMAGLGIYLIAGAG